MLALFIISIIPPKEEIILHIARGRLLVVLDSPFVQNLYWFELPKCILHP